MLIPLVYWFIIMIDCFIGFKSEIEDEFWLYLSYEDVLRGSFLIKI